LQQLGFFSFSAKETPSYNPHKKLRKKNKFIKNKLRF
jgi:hypothetical protein